MYNLYILSISDIYSQRKGEGEEKALLPCSSPHKCSKLLGEEIPLSLNKAEMSNFLYYCLLSDWLEYTPRKT